MFHCPDCGETFAFVESCPACTDGEAIPPWTLTKTGWRQHRIDGTTWRIDTAAANALVPVNSESTGRGILATCKRGHRYRVEEGLPCPGCSAAADHSDNESGTSARTSDSTTKPKTRRLTRKVVITVVVVAVTSGIGVGALLYNLDLEEDQAAVSLPTSTPATTQPSPTTTAVTTTTAAPTTTSPPTTTQSLDAIMGWVTGACVAFDGDFAEPVDCDNSHDAEIIDVAGSEDGCPFRSEWFVELDRGVACLVET